MIACGELPLKLLCIAPESKHHVRKNDDLVMPPAEGTRYKQLLSSLVPRPSPACGVFRVLNRVPTSHGSASETVKQKRKEVKN